MTQKKQFFANNPVITAYYIEHAEMKGFLKLQTDSFPQDFLV